MIQITILNSLEIAEQKSWLVKLIDRITPGYVRQKVDETIAKKIQEELISEGVRIHIEILPNEESNISQKLNEVETVG